MTQYFTDFSTDTVGQKPAGTTLRYQASSAHYLVENRADSTGGKVLNVDVGSVVSGLSWDDIDTDAGRADIEIVTRFIAPAGIAGGRLFALSRGDPSLWLA